MHFRFGELSGGTGGLARGEVRRRMVGFTLVNAEAIRGIGMSAFAASVTQG